MVSFFQIALKNAHMGSMWTTQANKSALSGGPKVCLAQEPVSSSVEKQSLGKSSGGRTQYPLSKASHWLQ